jgi:aspartate 1-decarboxylase
VLCSPEEVQKHQAKVLVMNPDNTVKETVFHRAMEG